MGSILVEYQLKRTDVDLVRTSFLDFVRNQAFFNLHRVPGTWTQVPGNWYQVPGTRYQILYQVPGTRESTDPLGSSGVWGSLVA